MDEKEFIVKPSFSFDSFEPFLTKENMEIHFEKHHLGYFKNLQNLINTNKTLEEIITTEKDYKVLNNALQVYNHNFFWQSIHYKITKNQTIRTVLDKIDFFNKFEETSNKTFGSGWCWLVWNNGFEFINTTNAERPNGIRLLCLDLWEHSYYLSYKWNRKKYIKDFLENSINYEFLEQNIKTIPLFKEQFI